MQVEKIDDTCAQECCVPPPLILPPRTDQLPFIREAFRLEWLTIKWMTVEAVVAIAAGVTAGSLVLIAFGLDSVIELASAGVLMWRLTVELRTNAYPALIAAPLLFAANAQAEEKEPSAIVEIGGAGEWGLPGSSSFGPSAAIEFTPIKNWLEIEGGVSTLFGGGQTEWSADPLFKKPFTLSDQVEFMVGVGPEWTFSQDGTKIAGEVAADFMFWPTPDRKYGWFVEPSYSYSFSQGHEQSLGVSVGLLIPIP